MEQTMFKIKSKFLFHQLKNFDKGSKRNLPKKKKRKSIRSFDQILNTKYTSKVHLRVLRNTLLLFLMFVQATQ
ncbi:unnamed protein product [Paramecium octaurelia]|uniref:Uncharacterized protein n=1 Tax=Paramecium octaurelia TaxID=43137 RepID=A0A8S1W0V5_PAROT|nr:unnamed protein product [Paramecium octaurelia]